MKMVMLKSSTLIRYSAYKPVLVRSTRQQLFTTNYVFEQVLDALMPRGTLPPADDTDPTVRF